MSDTQWMTTIKKLSLWVSKAPKVDLHRHLQGSIRTSSIIDIAKRHGITLPTYNAKQLERLVKITTPARNLSDYLRPWDIFSRIVQSPDTIERIVYEAIEDASEDNVCYLELRLAPYLLSNKMKLQPREILEAVASGLGSARKDFQIIVKLILGVARVSVPRYFAYNLRILEAAKDYRGIVVGFDLTGDEARFPPRLYREFFRQVEMTGFKITIHAGEAGGSRNVKEAIELLHADRIGHGTRAISDRRALHLLQGINRSGKPIPLEVCPSSTYLTGSLKESHVIPRIRNFLDRGVVVTINTDNPQVCNTTLSRELKWLLDSRLISFSELVQLMKNSIDYSFASEDVKAQLTRNFQDSLALAKE